MTDELTRVRNDLSIMQEAAGLGLPFDREDARIIALGAFVSLPMTIWGLFGSDRAPYPELVIVITLIVIYALSSYLSRKALKERHEHPRRWREHKLELLLVLVLSTAGLSYLAVGLWNQLSWNVAMATAIFIAGVSTIAVTVVDRSRIYLLGGALPTLVYGALFPLYSSRQLLLATAAWIAISCLATAALMMRQLQEITLIDETD